MNRQPPLPPSERLDAEERALAASLPRVPGRAEPGADLDARILAAAQAALHPQPASRRPRRSWIAPTAVAASLMLALGLAWQLRPPPAPDAPAAAASADSAGPDAGGDAMMVQAIEAPPPPASVATVPESAQMKPAPPAAETPIAAGIAGADARQAAPAEPQPAAVPPPAPPAPPAPVAPVVADSPAPAAMSAGQIAAPARAQVPMMAKSAARSGDAARERAADNDAAQAQEAAAMAADASTLDTVAVGDDPGEDVPPATADSPEVRDAWLRRIGELLKQGKHDDAKASLAEFRRRYPDASLPPELRKLEH